MKILCANWQIEDDADLERQRYPDIEFILARPLGDVAAALDPTVCASVDAVINYSATLNVAASPATFTNARIAVRFGVGFDNIDPAGWGAHNVPACNVPDYGTTEVADHALALMLALTRGTSSYSPRLQREATTGWDFRDAPLVRRHKGATFGVVGLGRIGFAAARRAAAFDMRIVFFDPLLPSGVDLSTGFTRVNSLAELTNTCDVVSLHTPLTDSTRGMFDEQAFTAARNGLILINTARGPIIDLTALENALRTGRVGGAGLDVLPNEPQDLDHPLLQAWRNDEPWLRGRLVISPHAAFYSPASMRDLRLKAIEVVHTYIAEGRLTNCINAEYLTA